MPKGTLLPQDNTPTNDDYIVEVDMAGPTTKKVKLSAVIGLIYPIGSIYTEVTGTNPGTTFGVGTWVSFGSGRVPIGIDTSDTDFSTVELTGGSKINTHNHFVGLAHDGGAFYITTSGTTGGTPRSRVRTVDHMGPISFGTSTGATREDSTYDEQITILPPFITVYMWKRTA
jgi:hypothetical protein